MPSPLQHALHAVEHLLTLSGGALVVHQRVSCRALSVPLRSLACQLQKHCSAKVSSAVTWAKGLDLPFTGRLAGALNGFKTAEGRHETLLAMLRTHPASILTPVSFVVAFPDLSLVMILLCWLL